MPKKKKVGSKPSEQAIGRTIQEQSCKESNRKSDQRKQEAARRGAGHSRHQYEPSRNCGNKSSDIELKKTHTKHPSSKTSTKEYTTRPSEQVRKQKQGGPHDLEDLCMDNPVQIYSDACHRHHSTALPMQATRLWPHSPMYLVRHAPTLCSVVEAQSCDTLRLQVLHERNEKPITNLCIAVQQVEPPPFGCTVFYAFIPSKLLPDESRPRQVP